jgi:heme/copper-type cytochrome/quinol oxidase subunit 1
MHGTVMMFLFAVPIGEAFAMTLLPSTVIQANRQGAIADSALSFANHSTRWWRSKSSSYRRACP